MNVTLLAFFFFSLPFGPLVIHDAIVVGVVVDDAVVGRRNSALPLDGGAVIEGLEVQRFGTSFEPRAPEMPTKVDGLAGWSESAQMMCRLESHPGLE